MDFTFDYHYGMEAEQYAFFRIPKVLISDPYFKRLSTDAKLLYGLMLDRMSLSIKNRWLDEQERVYIYFTLEDVCEQLCCKNDKAIKLFAELDSVKGIGLIERVRQGQGKPSRIYVKRFSETSEKSKSRLRLNRFQDIGKTDIRASENQESGLRETGSQDFGKTVGNNTDVNHTKFSNTELSIHQSKSDQIGLIEKYRTKMKEKLSYDFLIQQHPFDDIGEIIDLMVEVFCTQEDFIRIGKKQVYTELVKERFSKLDYTHIEYIMECMKASPSSIRNMKAYLLEALFNAPATIGNYYKAKVNHDFLGSG